MQNNIPPELPRCLFNERPEGTCIGAVNDQCDNCESRREINKQIDALQTQFEAIANNVVPEFMIPVVVSCIWKAYTLGQQGREGGSNIRPANKSPRGIR